VETTPEPEGAPPGPAPPDGTAGTEGAEWSTGPGGPGDDVDGPVPHDPLRFNRWMKRSASGAVLSGIALGLQQALEHRRESPAFVLEAPGEPEDPDAPITLHFDPDDPTKTVAVIRSPRADPEHPPGP